MQRQTKQTPARRRAPQQIDLFAAEPQMTIGGMPAWSSEPHWQRGIFWIVPPRSIV